MTRGRVIGAASIAGLAALLAGCVGPAGLVSVPGGVPASSATSTSTSTMASTSVSASATPVADQFGRAHPVFPVLSPSARTELYVSMRLSSMTLEQRIASLFMVHVAGSDPAALQAYLDANEPGGLLLLGDNVPGSTEQTAALTGSLHQSDGLGTLIAIDEEGGIVARLTADGFASAETLKGEPFEATGEAFAQRAALLEQAGATVNFGVVADVTADPSSFIYERVLGTDPASASARVAAAVGAEQGHVFSTLKHFPGHGAAEGDSHSSIPATGLSLDEWRVQDAPPFAAGIDAGAPLVMFGHLVYSSVDATPASLSAEWHRILRDELGFDGVAVTDDLLMLENSGVGAYADRTTNAIAAIAAGNDLLLYNTSLDLPPLVDAVEAAVAAGTISPATIDEAATRVLELRRALWLQNHPADLR